MGYNNFRSAIEGRWAPYTTKKCLMLHIVWNLMQCVSTVSHSIQHRFNLEQQLHLRADVKPQKKSHTDSRTTCTNSFSLRRSRYLLKDHTGF